MVNRSESKWYKLVTIINLDTDKVISRRGIINSLDYSGFDKTSIDTYRNYLCKAGFLSQTSTRGQFRVIQRIPLSLTLRECKKLAYPTYYEKTKECL